MPIDETPFDALEEITLDDKPIITEAQLAEQRANLLVVEAERAAREQVQREERERHAAEHQANVEAQEKEREARGVLAALERARQDVERWRFFREHSTTIIEDGLPLNRWVMQQHVQVSYGGIGGAIDRARSLIQ